jgi:amino acid adenylation domain-containing protein
MTQELLRDVTANRAIESIYPLSPLQQGMLFHSLAEPASGLYLVQVTCMLRGRFDVAAFQRAWQRVLTRHGALRTAFVWEGQKQAQQVVLRDVSLPFEVISWTTLSSSDQKDRLDEFMAQERRTGFELSQAPLMRMTVFQVAPDTWRFVWAFHHLILDGWSLGVVLDEVVRLYEAYSRGGELELAPPRPYSDYIRWLGREDPAAAEAFWRDRLRGLQGPTIVPVDVDLRPQVVHTPEDHVEHLVSLPAALTAQLTQWARVNRLTLSTIAQGLWALLLSRYTQEEDVVFGCTVSGRPPDLPSAETIVGLFINTLPLRARVPFSRPALPWLHELQQQQAEARQFEHANLLDVQRWSGLPQGEPMFESLLVFENFPVRTSLSKLGGNLEMIEASSSERVNYPITFGARPGPELVFGVLYDRRRLRDDSAGRMLGHLLTLARGLLEQPHARLSELPLLSAGERRMHFVDWNTTAQRFSDGACLHELFEAQVERSVDGPAVVSGDIVVTYGQLDRKANQVARRLRELGVERDQLVAVLLSRSVEMVAGVMGILKAGAAYLPLDQSSPPERLGAILAEAAPQAILTESSLANLLPDTAMRRLLVDADRAEIEAQPGDRLGRTATAGNLAYAIYTSGTTGSPKGILIEHRSACNAIQAAIRAFELGAGSRLPQLGPLTFDISVYEIFAALLSGASLHLIPPSAQLSPDQLATLLRRERISMVALPPSILNLLPDDPYPELRTIAVGGEKCSAETVSRWAGNRIFFNAYGPTEATIYSTLERCLAEARDRDPSLGRPIANTSAYLLDRALEPVPVGVPGEVFIGGVGVARGYLSRPDLTAEAFLPDPFPGEPGRRMYRTGDLARQLVDGRLDYIGRIDDQVKLRGFRIELDEIAGGLRKHPAVRDCVAAVWEDPPGDKRLVAYVVTATESGGSPAELARYLHDRLPSYMLPQAYVFLSKLPLTANGKVDRRALPAPSAHRDVGQAHEEPRTQLERTLAGAFQDVLQVDRVGLDDDFFELGGHSLLLIQIASRLRQVLGDISVVDVYMHPTVRRLAAVIAGDGRGQAAARDPLLIPLQPDGTRKPFFCVHPLGGDAFVYSVLARRLGPEQRFFGIQAPEQEGFESEQLEDVAARYLQAVRSVEEHGPYQLGGWSFGGWLAFEMARQLVEQGEHVSLLALLDTPGPQLASSLPDPARQPWDEALADFARERARQSGRQLDLSSKELKQVHQDDRPAHILERMTSAGLLAPGTHVEELLDYERRRRKRAQMMRRYRARTFAGVLHLFRASRREATHHRLPRKLRKAIEEETFGWAPYADQVLVHQVPGGHDDMVYEPNVGALAAELDRCLMAAHDLVVVGRS